MDTEQEQPTTSIDEPIFSRKSLLPILGFAAAIATGLYCAGPAYPSFILPNRIPSQTLQPLDSWLEQERPIALQGILDNIGPTGSKATGAHPGIIVASPSKSDPDYFYTWTRDSALTIETLVQEFTTSKSPQLERIIEDYVSAQAVLQGVENPSGGLCSGGLGEAKFTVKQTAFTGDWGRPQRDGPALRAIALSAYARHLMSEGRYSTYWNLSTFDLWEEVKGASFFTTAMQYRALVQGSRLAHGYWHDSYILSNTDTGRSGKDLNSILTSTHMFDLEAGCDSVTFQPCSDKALVNHKAVTDSFRPVYAINKDIPTGIGVAVGRYTEDVYMGGNPWYIGNFAAAEMLYQAAYQWKRLGSINITSVSQAFFKDVYPSANIGTITEASPEFKKIYDAVLSYADSYMEVARKYTPDDGALSEQFSRDDGRPLSARDLTWSYVAFLTVYHARKEVVPASWGANKRDLPSACMSSSATGPCSTATHTAWPSIQT